MSEFKRIQDVYHERDSRGVGNLYSWWRPEILLQTYERNEAYAVALHRLFGGDISDVRVLDIGCGTGAFLRTLLEWGATPERVFGTELLEERLEVARRISPGSMNFHCGDLSSFPDGYFGLIVANLVFTSILNAEERRKTALEMSRVLAPGGVIMVFDFRYNNPFNKQVKKVNHRDLVSYWSDCKLVEYRTLILLPPISRVLARISSILCGVLASFSPLRSHFVVAFRRPTKNL
jgi:SAM-dependent methyltransferase